MHPGTTEFLGLSGYMMVAVICGLIVLEELGVPLPVAPGDLLLVLAGASIATAHLNPLLVVAATYLSALLGAFCGRELFERVGSAALPRITAMLHTGDRVDRLTARLRRGGSTAVFLGRITPGLRIVTTYVAGLTAMPRRTFFIGLAPGVAAYQAVFLSLGFWLGPTALKTIEHHAPNSGALLLLLASAAGLGLVGHAIFNRLRFRGGRAERGTMAAAMPSNSSTFT
jgi:membrane protein DedA with SNARE-associated domain